VRRITLFIVGTVCGLVLLFSYRTSTMGARAGGTGTPADATAPPGIVGAPAPAPSAGSAGPVSSSGAAPSSGAPAPAPAAKDVVVNGTVANTRWGPVQVQVHISGGRIVDVKTLQTPHGNQRDLEINSYAVPVLRKEVLDAQSADIDTVSGATVTSDGYIRSLQYALDAAHFKS
jgi:uncharacterized protein with FMN-binding domain